jgi:serine/threonine-protein kinase
MEKVCPKCNKSFPLDLTFCPDDQERLIVVRGELLTEGAVIDERYRILGLLGKGGMGAVYRAYQLLMDREVAFKVLKSDMGDPSVVKRFFIEAKSASRLTHPNTITIFDFGQTKEGLLYMAMELVKGQSLAKLIKDGGPMPAERCVHIVGQICDSISEAHAQGIIHRDLKPDNILIEVKDWNPDFVKVLDFGIAKLVGGSDGTAVTKTGIVCGTPQYMSPEAITGQAVTPAADLYSLGIILYEMLSGVPPFQAETPMKLLLSHLNEQPKSLVVPGTNIEIPVQLDRFIMRVLSKKPEARPATARQFKEELLASLHEFKKKPSTTTMKAMGTGATGARELLDPAQVQAQARTTLRDDTSLDAVLPAEDRVRLTASTPRAPEPAPSVSAAVSYDDLERTMQGGSKKGLLIGAVVFALVGLGVLGWALLGGKKAPEPAPEVAPAVVAAPEKPAAPAPEKPAAPAPAPVPLKARLESTPAGANVTLNGASVCVTPCDLTYDAAEKGVRKDYVLKRTDYVDEPLAVTVGEKDAWSVALKAVPPAPPAEVAKPAAPAPKPVVTAPKPAAPKPVAPKKKKVDIDIEPSSF